MRPTFKSICLLFVCIASFYNVCFSQIGDSPMIMLNEVYIGSLEDDDVFIELIVFGQSQNPCDFELPQGKPILLDDAENGKGGYLALKFDCIKDAQKGDLIVIHGAKTDVSQSDAKYRFRIDNACIEKWEEDSNSQGSGYHDGIYISHNNVAFKDFISFDNDNIIQVRTRDSLIQNITISKEQSNYSLTYGNPNKYENGKPSPKLVNNQLNKGLITTLDNLNDNFFVTVEVIDASSNTTDVLNDVLIDICQGTQPYFVEIESIGYSSGPFNSFAHTVFNLPCGSHTIVISDSSGNELEKTVIISLASDIEIYVCSQSKIHLPSVECLGVVDPCFAWFPEQIFANQPNGNATVNPILDVADLPQLPAVLTLEVSDSNGNIISTTEVTLKMGEDSDLDGVCTPEDTDDNNPCIPNGEIEVDITSSNGVHYYCTGDQVTLDITFPPSSTLLWSTGETTATLPVESTGTYSVTVTDQNGCSGSDEFYIQERFPPIISYDSEVILCPNYQTQLIISPNDPDYNYNWSTGSTTSSIYVTQPGTYTATVTSFNSCTLEATFEVSNATDSCCDPSNPVSLSVDLPVEVCPNSSQTLLVSVSGGTPPYNITYPQATNLGDGLFSVEINVTDEFLIVVEDAYKCNDYINFEVEEVSNATDTDGDGVCDDLDPDPNDACNPYVDTDDDGICDAEDCSPTVGHIGPGLTCDDFDPCTYNDVYVKVGEDCECIGKIVENCDCNTLDSPCTDNNHCTTGDRIISTSPCLCEGTLIDDCYECAPQSPCDDNDPCTINDVIFSCECSGEDISDNTAMIPCDDGDDCTYNDVYVDCECVGTTVDLDTECDYGDGCSNAFWTVDENDNCSCELKNATITTNFNDNPCNGMGGILTSQAVGVSYSWIHDYKEVSSKQSCFVTQPGTYKLILEKSEGCYISGEYTVVTSSTESITIDGTQDKVCAEPVTLSVDDQLPNVVWYSSTGVELATGPILTIEYPGTFKAVSTDNGCDQFGTYTLMPAIDVDATITFISSAEICKTGKFTLSIEDPGTDVNVTWGGPDVPQQGGPVSFGYPFLINVYKPGTYTVTIESNEPGEEGCLSVGEYTVPDLNQDDSIEEFLIQQGFSVYPITFGTPPVSTTPQTYEQRTEGCEFGEWNDDSGYQFDNVTIDFGNGETTQIPDLNQYLSDATCNRAMCEYSVGALFVSSLCNEISSDLSYFLNFGGGFDASTKIYIQFKEGDQFGKILIKEGSGKDTGSAPIDPDFFKKFFYNLICDYHNGATNYGLISGINSITWTSSPVTLYDGNEYTGVVQGNGFIDAGFIVDSHFVTDIIIRKCSLPFLFNNFFFI